MFLAETVEIGNKNRDETSASQSLHGVQLNNIIRSNVKTILFLFQSKWATRISLILYVQEWRGGENTLLSPTWPRSRSWQRRHNYVGWVCCWLSLLLREVFLRVLRFSPLLKNNVSKFQFDHESGREATTGYVCGSQASRRRTTMWICYL